MANMGSEQMILKRIGPWSTAKVFGAIYAVLGLIVGLFFMLAALIGGLTEQGREQGALWGAVFGVGAVVILPVFYGVMGVVGGALGAWLYNVFAGMVGGIEVQLESPGDSAARRL